MLQKRKGVFYGKEEINFINKGKLWKLGAGKYHENVGSGRLGAGRSDVSFSAGFPAETPAAWVTGILCLIFCAYTFYMWRCREAFDFKKGDIMGDVHQFLVDHLKWDGKGTFLDIGCGAGALTMRCAKTFPKASFVGMDYWGKEWSYAKEQCEQNAKLEGVAARGRFEKGDAAKLAFPDETFDAVVSNFVFHEVRTAKDKRDVVREALRVLKKGGAFSLQDMFAQKALYGDMEDLVKELKAEGFAEVHYIANIENQNQLVPKFIQTPWMIKGAGVLYGVK